MPFTASLSRSLIQQTVGGRTQLASLISCGILISVLLWIGPFFEPLPRVIYSNIIRISSKIINGTRRIQFSLTVRPSQHHRGSSKGDANESDRVQEVLEIRQNRWDYLGGDIRVSDPVGRGIRPFNWNCVLRREIDLLLCPPLHLLTRSSTRYRALSGYQEI